MSKFYKVFKNVKYNDSTQCATVFKIVDTKTEIALFGEYGRFICSLIGHEKEYIDTFTLFFESKEKAQLYMEKYIETYNAFENTDIDESRFKIVEMPYDNSGYIVCFDCEEELI